MNERKIIYVAGYPKSGTTWLTRLLGRVLDCPTGGSMAKEDAKEIATGGQNRKGPYVVRKGHFRLYRTEKVKRAVPKPHVLVPQNLRTEKTVFIVRDPRDICVSGAHHWGVSVKSMVNWITEGVNGFRHCGSWHQYVTEWIMQGNTWDYSWVHYEDLLKDAETQVQILLDQMGIKPYMSPEEAVRMESFEARKADIRANGDKYPLGKGFNTKFMRAGRAGDWKSHFTRQMANKIDVLCGAHMRWMGYIENDKWIEEMPK